MRYLLVAALTLSAGVASAQDSPQTNKSHAIVALPDQVTWGPGPTSLPPGAKAAVRDGSVHGGAAEREQHDALGLHQQHIGEGVGFG